MTHFKLPRVRRFNRRSLVRRTNSLVGPRRRLHSWFRGWRDGKAGLNGRSSAPEFRNSCNFLQKTQAHAHAIDAECERAVTARRATLEEALLKLRDREAQIAAAAQEYEANAEGLRCERPNTTPGHYYRLLVFLFVAEVAFSYLNLMYSDMGGLIVEAVLSVVFAGCLVGLADTIGKRYRQLPLSLSAPEGARVKIFLEIVFFSLVLIGVLSALTYMRARGMRARGDFNNSDLLIELALFVIGFGFLAYSAWISGQVEYSGPKHGLARLERLKLRVTDRIKAVEGELRSIGPFRESLGDLLGRNRERVSYIYVDQYKRHEPQA